RARRGSRRRQAAYRGSRATEVEFARRSRHVATARRTGHPSRRAAHRRRPRAGGSMSPSRRRKAGTPRQNQKRRPPPGRDSWGTAARDDDAPHLIRLPDDPAAMIKSLGPPPVPGHETAAEHYFDAVYDKAAQLAVALAAASGLLDLGTDDDQ